MHRDLDDPIGTWVEDPEFDAAVEAMDRVDPDTWRGGVAGGATLPNTCRARLPVRHSSGGQIPAPASAVGPEPEHAPRAAEAGSRQVRH